MKNSVTITIPVYNGGKYIREALQSIVDQTRKVDRIVVCDNHSTDNTADIVNEFKQQYIDWQIDLYINEKNLGNIRNYNRCMELCKSDFLLILSSDDRLKPRTIETQLEFFNKNPEFAVVGGQVDYIDENGDIICEYEGSGDVLFKKGEILELINATGLWIQHSSVLLNTKYTNEIGLWDEKHIGGDERFWAEVLSKYPIALLGQPLVDERKHAEQLGRREHLRYHDKIMHFKTNYKIVNLETDPKRIANAKVKIRHWVASQCLIVSKSVWNNFGEKRLAVKYWFYGLKTCPGYYFNRYIYLNIKKVAKRILGR